MTDILDAVVKGKKLVDQCDISNLVTNSDLSAKLATLAAKVELKAKQDEIMQLQAFDSSFFQGKMFFAEDGFQKMSVYRPTFNTLGLEKIKGTEDVIGWKSKRVYNFKLTSLHGTSLLNKKNIRMQKTGIQFHKTPLVVEQNNYATKITNTYIVCDLNNWSKIPLINFPLKNCLLEATSIRKDKSKYV